MRRVRWECPAGAHAAVLAPARPPKDDVRRFCIECSRGSGRLQKRVPAALEKERERRHLRAKEWAKKKAAREAEKLGAYYRHEGFCLRAELDLAWSLPVVREWLARRGAAHRAAPNLRVRRQKALGRLYGTARHGRHEVMVVVAPGITLASLVNTILHEVAHLALGPHHGHDATWKATFATLRRERFEALDRRPLPFLVETLAKLAEEDGPGTVDEP